ncbi:phage replication protein O [Cohnella sp. OV330]|uniref:replication protein n=1 Tax=Cohnella sp. OV330 TaxID=1855288 RepID=UPI0008E9E79D|nr:replication protein [Cohnella sp. OV330]SFA90987.1 phage replication protein O [Cohnella sp. OV330]
MARGPQLEDGFTRIANEILEKIGRCNLNGTQRGIIDQIWRYTYGFGRKDAALSISFIARALEKQKSQVDRELTALIDRNIVTVVMTEGGSRSRVLRFNKDYSTWQSERRQRNGGHEKIVHQNEDESSAKKSTRSSTKTRTKKDSKERNKETPSRNSKRHYPEDDQFYKMAVYFHGLVQQVAKDDPKLKHLTVNANLQSWANDFRLLFEQDKQNDKHLIRDVMDWVTKDDFWKANVLSASKFRKQFQTLAIKMRASNKAGVKKPDPKADELNLQIRRDEALRVWMAEGNDPDDFVFDE